jgi:hypothetical protein
LPRLQMMTLAWFLVRSTVLPAFNEHSVAFGEHSVAFREHSVAFGEHSVAFREHSVAFGEHSVAFRRIRGTFSRTSQMMTLATFLVRSTVLTAATTH